jgi:hypothetical protein
MIRREVQVKAVHAAEFGDLYEKFLLTHGGAQTCMTVLVSPHESSAETQALPQTTCG